MSTMPLMPFKPPSAVAAQPNGDVDPSMLSPIDRPGYLWQFAALPARGMMAMRAAIQHDLGVTLNTTGRGRDLHMQWDIFCGTQARYKPVALNVYNAAPAADRKHWPANDWASGGFTYLGRSTVARLLVKTIPNSDYWIKISSNLATAATPGSSPHGWWCADDLALPDGPDADSNPDSLSAPVLDWLYNHEVAYGFAHGLTSEPWHIQWVVGDTVPQAVLDYETSLVKPPIHPDPPEGDMYLGVYVTTILGPDGKPITFYGNCTRGGSALIFEWASTDEVINNLLANPDSIVFDGRDAEHPQFTKGQFGAIALLGAMPPGYTKADFKSWHPSA